MALATPASDAATAAAPAPRRRVWREVARRRLAVLALGYLLLFYAAGLFAPVVATHDPNADDLRAEAVAQGPSFDHWLGTDLQGRDLYSRTVYAARTTILFTVAVLLTGGLLLGIGLGLLAGYRGGWVDTAVMRTGEVMAGIPALFVVLALTAAFRPRINDLSFWLEDHTFFGDDARTFVQFLIIVGATVPFAWIGTSRIVRGQALALREAGYVLAAESMGASTPRILVRHILPGVMPLVLVGFSAGMAGIAGTEVALSFLGLGVTPPASSFGTLLEAAAGVRTFQAHPHLLLAPGIPLVLFFFAWNLLGDALVDILEPRRSAR